MALHHFTIFIIILCISTSTHFTFISHGTTLSPTTNDPYEEMLRSQMGSLPPRCDHQKRCKLKSCKHCKAIQVPTNHKIEAKSAKKVVQDISDDNTNYKPMSWKCKCGKFIFDP